MSHNSSTTMENYFTPKDVIYNFIKSHQVLAISVESFTQRLQHQNKLISSERLFKILQNETKIIKISQAVLEILNFKD